MKNFSLILVLALIGCSRSGGDGREVEAHVNLLIEDSIQVDYIGVLNLMDVDPANGHMLLFDQQTRDFVVTDLKGEIKDVFNKTGDGPDSFGNFPLTPGRFTGGDEFTILSYTGVYRYDLQGGLTSSVKFAQPARFMGRASAEWEFYLFSPDSILSVGVEPWGEHSRDTPEYYEAYQTLNWMDLRSGESTRFLGLEENSIFKNGMGHEVPDMIPVMAYEDGKIYMIVGKDLHLNVYSADPPYQLLDQVNLELRGFQQDPGLPYGKIDPKAIKVNMGYGRIKNLKLSGEYVLVSYFPGLSETDLEAYESAASNAEKESLWEELSQKYPPRLQVLSRDLEQLGDFEIPQKLHDQQFIVRNEKLWFLGRPNIEQEEDFFKVYQVNLE
jgi:hypothetical protein